MRDLKKKTISIFLGFILILLNFQNLTYVFASEKNIISTGYINIPSWISTRELNVRSKPSTSAPKIGSIKHGVNIDILDGITEDEDNNGLRQGWFKVQYNNTFGYVFGDYVKLYEKENTYIPSNVTKIKGIDVSHNQGKIDWEKVKNDNIEFAIIRGGYSTIEDSYFKENIEGALNAGIEVGVYWFSHAYTTDRAIAEADKCLSVISAYKDKLSYPVYFDFEDKAIKKAEENNIIITMTSASKIAETFLSKLKSNGYKCGLYTNNMYAEFYFNKNLRTSYDIWMSQPGEKCTYWNRYSMWQYSYKGKVDGINGNVDLNYYYKDNPIKTVKNLKVLSTTASSIKLGWSKVSNASGYEIYKSTSKSGPYAKVDTIKNNSIINYTNSKLSSNKKYYYKVRAYKSLNGNKSYGDFSSVISGQTKLAIPSMKLSTPKSKSVKVSWNKISGAKGYEVYRASSKKGTYYKKITTSKLSYTNTKLTKNKTYYYKVRAYKIVNNKKVYSSFSTIKFITAR